MFSDGSSRRGFLQKTKLQRPDPQTAPSRSFLVQKFPALLGIFRNPATYVPSNGPSLDFRVFGPRDVSHEEFFPFSRFVLRDPGREADPAYPLSFWRCRFFLSPQRAPDPMLFYPKGNFPFGACARDQVLTRPKPLFPILDSPPFLLDPTAHEDDRADPEQDFFSFFFGRTKASCPGGSPQAYLAETHEQRKISERALYLLHHT